MEKIDIKSAGNICAIDLKMLEANFGRSEIRLYELVRGIDHTR